MSLLVVDPNPESLYPMRIALIGGMRPASSIQHRVSFDTVLESMPNGATSFPKQDAVSGAVRIKFDLHKFGRVVLLGTAVRDAFVTAGVIPKGMGWFDSTEKWRGHKVTIISVSPHVAPSIPFWLEPASAAAGRAFWEHILKEVS